MLSSLPLALTALLSFCAHGARLPAQSASPWPSPRKGRLALLSSGWGCLCRGGGRALPAARQGRPSGG
eukprot:783883-Pleurochrysis_carterae.AAC.1